MADSLTPVCSLDDIPRNGGACALVNGRQVAIFRFGADDQLYALDNRDPFSGSNVLSRGIVGTRGDIPKVASPLYKQSFDLRTGQCLDDPEVQIDRFQIELVDGQVSVGSVLPADVTVG
jgi:nitrite reductase (NADH) small subunit